MPDAPQTKPPRRTSSHATKLVNLMTQNGTELFRSPDGHAFATVTVDDHRETLALGGVAMREYLGRAYFKATKKAATASALKDAINILTGSAKLHGPERPVFTRVARTDDQTIWLDLGRPAWDAIKVTSAGWEIVASPDVRFRRSRGLMPLPIPQRGGSLESLLDQQLNLSDARDRSLAIGWLIGALRGRPPYPILALSGEQGSAKSSASRAIRRVIDPNAADLRLTPKEPRDLMIAASNAHVLAFDNLSVIPEWLSDALCALATGGGFSTRELHSDNDEVLFSAARPIIINGITDVVTRADLLDRALVVTLDPIPEHRRRRESDLDASYAAAHPALLGALLDAVSVALKYEASTQLDRLPRMADFACWVTAAEPALGWQPGTFVKTYCDNRQSAVENSLDGDLIAEALRGLDLSRPWIGTVDALRTALTGPANRDSTFWPKNAKSLANALRRKAPALRQLGIDVTFLKRAHGLRKVAIRMIGQASQASLYDGNDERSAYGPF